METIPKRARRETYRLLKLPDTARVKLLSFLNPLEVIFVSQADERFDLWMRRTKQWKVFFDEAIRSLIGENTELFSDNYRRNSLAWFFAHSFAIHHRLIIDETLYQVAFPRGMTKGNHKITIHSQNRMVDVFKKEDFDDAYHHTDVKVKIRANTEDAIREFLDWFNWRLDVKNHRPELLWTVTLRVGPNYPSFRHISVWAELFHMAISNGWLLDVEYTLFRLNIT